MRAPVVRAPAPSSQRDSLEGSVAARLDIKKPSGNPIGKPSPRRNSTRLKAPERPPVRPPSKVVQALCDGHVISANDLEQLKRDYDACCLLAAADMKFARIFRLAEGDQPGPGDKPVWDDSDVGAVRARKKSHDYDGPDPFASISRQICRSPSLGELDDARAFHRPRAAHATGQEQPPEEEASWEETWELPYRPRAVRAASVDKWSEYYRSRFSFGLDEEQAKQRAERLKSTTSMPPAMPHSARGRIEEVRAAAAWGNKDIGATTARVEEARQGAQAAAMAARAMAEQARAAKEVARAEHERFFAARS